MADLGVAKDRYISDGQVVHMNGRVYDPFLGRMLSADPTVPGPFNSQAFNRYSYVLNNPLSFTDPSGFDPIGTCGGSPRCQPAADGAGGIDTGILAPVEVCNRGGTGFCHESESESTDTSGGSFLMNFLRSGSNRPGFSRAGETEVEIVLGQRDDGTPITARLRGHYQDGNFIASNVIATSELPSSFGLPTDIPGFLGDIQIAAGAISLGADGTAIVVGGVSIGSNLHFYVSGWHGNQYVSTARIGRLAGAAGTTALLVEVGTGLYGVVVWVSDTGSPNSVHPIEFMVDVGVTAGSIAIGGTAGVAVGGAHYYISNFYPGGYPAYSEFLNQLNFAGQSLQGGNYTPYRDTPCVTSNGC